MRNHFLAITAGLFSVAHLAAALTCDNSLLTTVGLNQNTSDATVTKIASGQTIQIRNDADCQSSFTTTTDICRVTLHVATSNQSGIYMEVWLPDNWNGRYVSTGNFGLNGCVKYDDMELLTGGGVAAGGADGGHAGSSGENFANNLDVVIDYSYRSVHTMTVQAKAVTKAYYNFTPNNNYYFGCSTGGRQGLQSAQMFPEDFDGIIAGSAAADFNNLAGWSGSFFPITGATTAATFVTADQWSAVHNSVMAKCDGIDGVIDGIIEDPDLCTFDPTTLQCGSTNITKCLTAPQVATVQKVLAPLRDSQNNLLYPQIQLGAETGLASFYLGGSANAIPAQWYQFAIFNGVGFSAEDLSLADIIHGDQLNLGNISSFSGDLSAFQKRGGKLITTHGLADDVITSVNSARYFKHVSHTMGLPPTSLDDFYRYFRISGMGHCGGGTGAINFDSIDALFNWVEKGVAPDTLLGTSPDGTVKRNHCRYPFRTTFVGQNANEVDGWNCTAIVDPSQVLAELV